MESIQHLLKMNTDTRASSVIYAKSVDDVKKIFTRGGDYIILGGGSNVLFLRDVEVPIVKIDIRGISYEEIDDNAVLCTIQAGEVWDDVVTEVALKGLWGIENLSAIPGSVGGGVVQNIGAYGAEIQDVVESVLVFDKEDGEVKKFTSSECEFEYRNSIFKSSNRYIVLSVTLNLAKTGMPNLTYGSVNESMDGVENIRPIDMAECIRVIRYEKLPNPTDEPNIGSFFKNPVVSKSLFDGLLKKNPDLKSVIVDDENIKCMAGQLIEKAGWLGRRDVNGVGTSDKHALVIVNMNGSSGDIVWETAENIQKEVFDLFGILLVPEVVIL